MRILTTFIIGFFLLFSLPTAYAYTPVKNWTFLVYINGNNSLDAWGAKSIMAMEKVGSDAQVNVVVQWASLSARKAVRLKVEKSTDPAHVTSPILEDLGLVDMGDYHTLQDFIAWGVKTFPARHYFIDVWGHGSGWHYTTLDGANAMNLNDISYDDISGHCITTEELKDVLSSAASMMGHKIDLYGSDACLMAMAEVAGQISNLVSYSVGSQDGEPADGWPYEALLSRWEAIPNARADQIVIVLTDAYINYYKNIGLQVTFSAFNLARMNDLNKAVKKLGESINALSRQDRDKVLNAAKISQWFTYTDYKDINDFIQNLSEAKIATLDEATLKQVQAATNEFVIANATTSQYQKAHGLSIWLPTKISDFNDYSDRYQKLDFNTNTQWWGALNGLLKNS